MISSLARKSVQLSSIWLFLICSSASVVAQQAIVPNEREIVSNHLAAAREQLGEIGVRYSFPVIGEEAKGGYIRHTYWFNKNDGLAVDSSHGQQGVDSDAWVERQKTIVFEDGWLATWPNKRSYAYSAESEASVPADLLDSPVFRAISLWPLRGKFPCGGADGSDYDLESLIADARYELSHSEDGHVVLEHEGRDRCVLDPEHCYALIERVWRNEEARETMRLEVPELQSVAESLWLPKKFHLDVTSSVDGVGDVQRLTGQLEEVLTSGRAGFDYVPPAGAMLLDKVSSALTQVMPGGEEFIVNQGDQVRRFTDAERVSKGTDWTSQAWLWGLLAMVGFGLIGRWVNSRSIS